MSKLHKVGERQSTPDRLADKDAHDIYRLLTRPTEELAGRLDALRRDELAGDATARALQFLGELFCEPNAAGAVMARRAEIAVGSQEVVAASTAALAADLIAALTP